MDVMDAMRALSPLVLVSDLRVTGYLALWVIVFLGSAGVPLPTDPVLLAAAVLVGRGDLNVVVVALVATSAAACGDSLGYLIGRQVGGKAVEWLERSRIGQRVFSARVLKRGGDYFSRYGGWAVFLSRWVAGVFSGVVNLLAGVRRFPFRTFLAYAVAGDVVDTAIMLTLGVGFGASWAAADTVLKVVSIVILSVLATGLLIVRLVFPLLHARSDPAERGDTA
jgi:membrane-associated protein